MEDMLSTAVKSLHSVITAQSGKENTITRMSGSENLTAVALSVTLLLNSSSKQEGKDDETAG